MKKTVLAGLVVLSISLMADSAKEILKRAREDYYRQQKETVKPVQRKKMKVVSSEITEENAIIEGETVKEIKPKTPMEKLEYNTIKAKDRVDFYERVVRSVEREEKELGGYNEVLGKNKKSKKSAMKKTHKETVKKGQKKK
ncbi:hypothetical protein EII29_09645 [Leptotrichia sp. OH3620_COT-345]|uniref:hypothetical protein n=1 Tax=Leptotrichia sp. OH3620_COT-345 TaxID=2491048 RepID=UPI000F64C893|nr:hypothetical protein [Leptotrichia sp. OH3620_COT-345]RRD38867.1 hypothetical protein EII29_09645 [Leptotrichia sp. OH3620_COT-345]